jgi:hypothetical protein
MTETKDTLTCKKCKKEFDYRVEIIQKFPLPEYQLQYYKKQLFAEFCHDCSFLETNLALEREKEGF